MKDKVLNFVDRIRKTRGEALVVYGIIIVAGFLASIGSSYITNKIKESNKNITIESPAPLIEKPSDYDSSVCGNKDICKTASGEIFNENNLTFASRNLPFGTIVEFEYNGKTVKCKSNDRGPYIDGRMFDLSKGYAEKLGILNIGVTSVNYKIIYE